MKKEIQIALIWGVIMLSLALAGKYARGHGYIDDDTLHRLIAMNGLWIAYYGNRIPKTFAPHASARKVQRVAGWSLVVSGLIYAGMWAFAPIPLAMTFGTGAVLAGLLLTFAFCLALGGKRRAGA